MDNLTSLERTNIRAATDEIKQKAFIMLEETKEQSDLVGLYQEIIAETSKHGKRTIIFDYAKLLEEENELYSPEEAYLFAKQSTHMNSKELVNQYLHSIAKKMSESGLLMKQQRLLSEICDLLGDVHGLITDFTQKYRRVNGIIAQHIDTFIKYGYIAKIPFIIYIDNKIT